MTVKTMAGVLLVSSGLAACAGTGMMAGQTERVEKYKTGMLAGFPLPQEARIAQDHSLILGEGEDWAGRIEIHAPQTSGEAVNFFMQQYPPAGWTLVSSIKAKNSILVFVQAKKSVTLEISDYSSLTQGSKIILTVAPRAASKPSADSK